MDTLTFTREDNHRFLSNDAQFPPSTVQTRKIKRITGKLLGYTSNGIHGVTGLFLIEMNERRLGKDISRAARKVRL